MDPVVALEVAELNAGTRRYFGNLMCYLPLHLKLNVSLFLEKPIASFLQMEDCGEQHDSGHIRFQPMQT